MGRRNRFAPMYRRVIEKHSTSVQRAEAFVWFATRRFKVWLRGTHRCVERWTPTPFRVGRPIDHRRRSL